MGKTKTVTETNETAKQDPWAPAMPYLTGGSTGGIPGQTITLPDGSTMTIGGTGGQQTNVGILPEAERLYTEAGADAHSGTMFPDLSQTTGDALGMIEGRARTGSSLIPEAEAELLKTLQGDYIGTSPGQGVYDSIMSGDLQNTATFTDPSAGFYGNLMQQGAGLEGDSFYRDLAAQGFENEGADIYGQIGGMSANRGAEGLFNQAAGTQATQSALGQYDQIGQQRANMDASALYDQIGQRQANMDASALYNQLGGMQANMDASALYNQLGGMQANTDARNMFQQAGGMQASTPSTGYYQGLMSGGFQDPSRQGYADMASGNFQQGENYFRDLANRNYTDPANNAMTGRLETMADMNPVSNPYVDDMLRMQRESIADNLGGIFGAGGRYGSGAHQELMMKETGDAATRMLSPLYESGMNRRLSAVGQLAGIGEGRSARDLQAMGMGAAGLEGMRQSDLGYQLAGLDRGSQSALMDLNARTQGADRLTSDAARADQFNLGALLSGAQGVQGVNQFADEFGYRSAAANAAGQAGLNQFADEFSYRGAAANAAGQAGLNQFADEFGYRGAAANAAGQAGLNQFADQYNLGAMLSGAGGRDSIDARSDAFNIGALLSGAQGLEGINARDDAFGLQAATTAASGLNNNALAQIEARNAAMGNLDQNILNNLGYQLQGAQMGTNSALQAADFDARMQGTNIGNMLGAAGASDAMYGGQRADQLNSILNAGMVDQLGYQDANNLLRVGQTEDILNSQRAKEEADKFYYEQDRPWQNLGNYANIVGGIAGLGGQSEGWSKTTQVQSGGLLGDILGGAMSLGGSLLRGDVPGIGGGGGGGPASMAAGGGGMLGGAGQFTPPPVTFSNPYANSGPRSMFSGNPYTPNASYRGY